MNLLDWASTGLKGLDDVINYLRKGDNVVWRVDNIQDYRYFVIPYVKKALEDNKRVVYMRFAHHEPLLEPGENIAVYNLDANSGFDSFTTQVHNIATREGEGVYYVFDCLSDLLSAWCTDLMIGNFFMIICPYLFELRTIAYFSILRNSHSFKTIARIRETTQLLLDIYDYEGNFYIHPLKVWNRYSPTMFLPHLKEKTQFVPIINSVEATKLFSCISREASERAKRHLDYWDRLFLEAENLLEKPCVLEEKQKMIDRLCKIMISKDERVLSIARDNFSLRNLLNIKNRLIGTGFIGGKAVGMLLARSILLRDQSFDWQHYLEHHDSFYIGSDVFYTYIVQNGWWKLWIAHKTKEKYFEAAKILENKMSRGMFPDEIKEQFQQAIEYFGQSPIIVRSSSLLEDSFGNAFAGKYQSIFLVNQGTPEQRYLQFEEAVRKVFASSMSEDALTYRLQRGLDQHEEQMALLVQRVSGSHRKQYFFPDLAGVGFSYNTFVWKKDLNPKAGMLRIVFGLGTRAVERVEDDYPRIVALDAPLIRHYTGEDVRRFSQHEVDVLNMEEDEFQMVSLKKLLKEELDIGIDLNLIGVKDFETARKMRKLRMEGQETWVLTFDKLFTDTPFRDIMQRMLKILESNYKYPIEIEFTVNFTKDKEFKINLVQCRPLQTKGLGKKVEIPADLNRDNILFESEGNFMGGNISQIIQRIIYVDPKGYSELSLSQKYDIARLVGRLNKQIKNKESFPTLLLGPGRWGTSTPSLGIPVSFSEINNIAALGEIAYSKGDLMPELSFGSHFFQDLVEANIFYIAIFPEKKNVFYNKELMDAQPNLLEELMPEDGKYKEVIRVCDFTGKELQILADVVSQKAICFVQ
ncbi:MAG: PEP/pyruvate-binding domain-containing protein [Desulfurellaceae bacterium]|nr:PEP/pyruvate-binding domain-containing protein [Desulfurellaceae bacterium]